MLGIITRLTGYSDQLSDLGVYEVPVITFAASVRKSSRLQIAYQVSDLLGHSVGAGRVYRD